MNQKSFVIAVILTAAALSVIATPLAYAQIIEVPEEDPATAESGDTSETSTDQNVKQKNIGSGESTNFNCGENLIKSGVEDQECEFED
jgi:hypothetical protein